MKRRHILGCGFALLSAATTLFAVEKFPQRNITLVVPGSPGGTTDFSGRLIADALGRAIGQPVVVDNKAGANGNIANISVARAKPDGYTLLVAYSGYQAGSPHLFKKLGWDPIKDFAPVAMLTRAPQLIAVRPGLPVNSLQELIQYAKSNPGKLNYGSAGSGSIQHIAGELLGQMTGISMTHIPYKGAAPAVQDMLGGSVDLVITAPATLISQIQAGRLKGLAVASSKRLASLPNVPTAAEAGLSGYELDSWFALYAPAGTPPEIIRQLNGEVNKILQMPEIRRRAEEAGTTVDIMTPQRLAEFTHSELERWGKVIKDAGISAE